MEADNIKLWPNGVACRLKSSDLRRLVLTCDGGQMVKNLCLLERKLILILIKVNASRCKCIQALTEQSRK